MGRYRCGKIVSTIGPASSSHEKLEELFLKGVDVFRLNFSHGVHDWHAKVYEAIRAIGKKYNRNPTVLADLQGPKLRIGTFENDKIILDEGDTFRFDLDKTPGNTRRVNLPHPEILEALHIGTTLLLDDGKLRFEVTDCRKDYVDTKVLVGGPLSNRKGVNIPQVRLNIPVLTEKDLKDLQFALDLGIDWIACSFVQTVEDIENAKRIVNGRAGVITKLEKPLAVQAMEPIIEASDAVMIARGDLGVEMEQEELPTIQRRIINTCHRMGRPVIVATQMLESMVLSPNPTRAEISDIATAVYSGADATMLSAESASGQYPFEAVSIMSKTIAHVEADPYCQSKLEEDTQLPQRTTIDAISAAAKEAAEYSCATAIVMFSDNFESIVRCARLRPRIPVVLVTSSIKVANKSGLCYGVYAVHENIFENKEFDTSVMSKAAKDIAKERKFAKVGDNIVVLNDLKGHSVEICQL